MKNKISLLLNDPAWVRNTIFAHIHVTKATLITSDRIWLSSKLLSYISEKFCTCIAGVKTISVELLPKLCIMLATIYRLSRSWYFLNNSSISKVNSLFLCCWRSHDGRLLLRPRDLCGTILLTVHQHFYLFSEFLNHFLLHVQLLLHSFYAIMGIFVFFRKRIFTLFACLFHELTFRVVFSVLRSREIYVATIDRTSDLQRAAIPRKMSY